MHRRPTWHRRLIALSVCLLLAAFAARASAQALEQSEHGSFVINTLEAPGGNTTYKGVIVSLGKNGEAAVCFDTESLRMSCGWVRGASAPADGAPVEGWAGLIDPRNSTSFTAFHGGPPRVGVYVEKKSGDKAKEKEAEAKAQETAKGMMRFATNRGPGWANGDDLTDPRQAPRSNPGLHLGPLPKDWGHWKGLYRQGDRVVFSYTVGDCDVLEMPGLVGSGPHPVFTRTIRVGKSDKPMTVVVADGAGTKESWGELDAKGEGRVIRLDGADPDKSGTTLVGLVNGPKGYAWSFTASPAGQRAALKLPPRAEPVVFAVMIWSGAKDGRGAFDEALEKSGKLVDPAGLTKGGPAQWGEPIETKGAVAASGKPDADAYVVDTLTAPYNNPWHAMTRFAGLDFFADGKRAALSTIGGDVWIVSGIDETLEHLKWKRFATGLFQPLGLKIVKDEVYTIGRDGLTKLVDLNGDGEADFYQNVNNDAQVTTNYHEFCLDLQTDAKGNFYYAKGSPWPPNVQSDNQGTMIRVSPDGSKFETFATGLRAPNGSGMGPGDLLVCSDNQGHWMPACKVERVQQGKFYGMVPAAHLSKGEKAPTTFEPPILWLPMKMDNSSGGEAFAPADGKWGPLAGHMVHLSYGMSSLFAVSTEDVDGVMQGAAVQFPLKFDSSLMRARFNPGDGQLYVTGLKGWQTNAGREGALHRVRYTGKPCRMPVGFHVHKNGLAVTFAVPLDKATAADKENWGVEQWNYKWTANYGSPEFSVKDPGKAKHDDVEVKSATLSGDGKTVFLETPDLQPVMQMRVRCNVKDADGREVKWDVYNTINRLGAEYRP